MRLDGLRNIFSRSRQAPVVGAAPGTAAMAGRQGGAAPSAPVAAVVSPWDDQRLAVAEALWGEGFLAPGGAEEVLRLAVPLGLSAASSLLLLGAGAGGPARVLAAELGVWVSTCDADPVLVDLAARRIQRAGAALAKRASVAAWNPVAPQFRRHGFHHALAADALHLGEPAAVLAALAAAIKPGGQMMLVELVADSPLDMADGAVAAWCRLERRHAALPSEAQVTTALARLGFEVRVVEDQSRRHIRQAIQGWNGLIRTLSGTRPSQAYAVSLVAEAELWMRRIRLLRDGRIRLVRWHATA
ncbi:methyltransferase domain-containing protein [Limobrevibacterium gyesilva]|uniref:Methyltransferase domain-containing protein n=1 Tax=Limobrevibacterium gyesilva TaxID=2991712 RepID=A0AA41YW22_9PROT|nr:methyltransferase domain-containing protein [Limobrevibacterium gyesilva]MCW3477445.1 hypothetical protein [Limobrevibacterium gyesilva]